MKQRVFRKPMHCAASTWWWSIQKPHEPQVLQWYASTGFQLEHLVHGPSVASKARDRQNLPAASIAVSCGCSWLSTAALGRPGPWYIIPSHATLQRAKTT